MKLGGMLLLACAGCDSVFGLEGRTEPDAEVVADVGLDGGPPTDGGIVPGTCWGADSGNEDADTITNGCDNCPADLNEGQEDSDRDGVGDACDPHPTFAIDRIAYFTGFDPSTIPTGLSFGGTWTTSSGRLQQNAANPIALFVPTIGPFRTPTLQVRTTNEMRGTGATWQSAVLLLHGPALGSNPDGIKCANRIDDAVPSIGEVTIVRMRGGLGRIQPSDVLPTGANAISFRLTAAASLEGDYPRCDVWRGAFDPTTNPARVELMASGSDPEMVQVGLYTQNVSTFFYSLVVYDVTWP